MVKCVSTVQCSFKVISGGMPWCEGALFSSLLAVWFHLYSATGTSKEQLIAGSCHTEPRESVSYKPSSRWWVVYVRCQQILSWLSNSIETTIGASIIKTNHHSANVLLSHCSQCLSKVHGCSVTWHVINIQAASLSASSCLPYCCHSTIHRRRPGWN